jgi:hypothetical protein
VSVSIALGEGAPPMAIAGHLARDVGVHVLLEVVEANLTQDRLWIRDDSCGWEERIDFHGRQDTTYSGPPGCFQNIRIRRAP